MQGYFDTEYKGYRHVEHYVVYAHDQMGAQSTVHATCDFCVFNRCTWIGHRRDRKIRRVARINDDRTHTETRENQPRIDRLTTAKLFLARIPHTGEIIPRVIR